MSAASRPCPRHDDPRGLNRPGAGTANAALHIEISRSAWDAYKRWWRPAPKEDRLLVVAVEQGSKVLAVDRIRAPDLREPQKLWSYDFAVRAPTTGGRSVTIS
jgi:hypothetical protein